MKRWIYGLMVLVYCGLWVGVQESISAQEGKVLLFITGNTYARMYLPPTTGSETSRCLICARKIMMDRYRQYEDGFVAIEYGRISAGDEGDLTNGTKEQNRRRTLEYLKWLDRMGYDLVMTEDKLGYNLKSPIIPANGSSWMIQKNGVKLGFIFLTKELLTNISAYNNEIAKFGGIDFLVVGVSDKVPSDLLKAFFQQHKEIDVVLVPSIELVPNRSRVYSTRDNRLVLYPPADGIEAIVIELEKQKDKITIQKAFWSSVLKIFDEAKEEIAKLRKGMPQCFCDADCGSGKSCISGKCKGLSAVQKSSSQLIVVRPKKCVSCNEEDIYSWLSGVIPQLKKTIIYTDDSKAIELLSAFPVEMLPLYILKGELDKVDGFESLEDMVIKTPIGWVLKPQVTGISVYWKRKVIPKRLDVFLVGKLDEETYKMIRQLRKVKKELPQWKFYFHYLLQKDKKTGVWSSMAGPDDMAEVLRQLCVKKYAPAKFLDYILCRYESGYSDVDTCVVRLGLNGTKIDRCSQSAGELEFLLFSTSKLVSKLQVNMPGLVLFENNQIFKPSYDVITKEKLESWSQGKEGSKQKRKAS